MHEGVFNSEGGPGSAEKGGEVKESGVTRRKAPKHKPHCISCGENICTGVYKVHEPKLMMWGSGELRAYCVE